MGQNRYVSLAKEFPDVAGTMFKKTENDAKNRYEEYKRMAER